MPATCVSIGSGNGSPPLFGAKPIPELMETYCILCPQQQISVKIERHSNVSIDGNALENVACEWWSFFPRGDELRISIHVNSIHKWIIRIYQAWSSLVIRIVSFINTLGPRQNGRHFPVDFFKCIFLNENIWIYVKISLKFILKGPINNIPALVQLMAWCRPGDKLLCKPMMVSILTQMCITRPQWINDSYSPTIMVTLHWLRVLYLEIELIKNGRIQSCGFRLLVIIIII